MRVLSGIQTSGDGELHIGNYLGAVRQWVDLQSDHESFYMLANLHALTLPITPEATKKNVYKIAALYLALGLDPAKSTIFVQSQIPEHAELAWILNCLATMGEMSRMTQFKDKGGHGDQQDSVSVGLFDYPVLMAADILLYQADTVPVGEDQKQHLELTRNLAERFNNKYGQTFVVPEYHAPTDAARIMGLNDATKKMSKSLGKANYLSFVDSDEDIREKIMSAMTDSENEVRFDKQAKPAISNLLVIFAAISGRSVEELVSAYASGGYGRFKSDLATELVNFISPIRAQYHDLVADTSALDALFNQGKVKAQAVAAQTLRDVKTKLGLL